MTDQARSGGLEPWPVNWPASDQAVPLPPGAVKADCMHWKFPGSECEHDLPEHAVQAATVAVADVIGPAGITLDCRPSDIAKAALAAAADVLRAQGAADERERIRKRATECETCGEVHLGYLLPGSDGHPYRPRFCSPGSTLMDRLADLLDGDPGD